MNNIKNIHVDEPFLNNKKKMNLFADARDMTDDEIGKNIDFY